MKHRLILLIVLGLLCSAGARAQEESNVCVSTTWRMAEVEARTLWVSEQSVALRVDERTTLQVGWQRFVAKGKVRTNRFSTSARWYGVERLLDETAGQQLTLSWRRLEGAEGRGDVAEGVFTYVAPRVETVGVLFSRNGRMRTSGYRLSLSRMQAGTERAQTTSFSLYTVITSLARTEVTLESGVHADRHRGRTTYRLVLGVEAVFPLGRDLQARLGATAAPQGFPLAGTPVEGLTAFAVFQPGGLVESWRDRPAGYLSLQVSMTR